MSRLTTLPATATSADVVEAIDRDGAVIVAHLMGADLGRRIDSEVTPYLNQSALGRDDFTGRQTKRTGALVARSPACREAVMNPLVLGACDAFLLRQAQRVQLHLTQLIQIHPGQGAQPLHRDRLAWGGYLPRSIEPQLNTIWALTDFTAQNGATRVVPGSNQWPDERKAEPSEVCQAVMKRGSVLFYSGSVIHSGGENKSSAPRLGMNITYCLSWLRQEENQFLSCPPEVARTLPEDLQELLGYTMGNYALGYFSRPENRMANSTRCRPNLRWDASPGKKPTYSIWAESS
ncbi:MAG: phytanoyl-CoA dioxygenase family protein [Gammaproteobacteria bacterium]|nr:phytanoyl-CoA dioxygenase family protein [Gammaproteobacteria bacterium]